MELLRCTQGLAWTVLLLGTVMVLPANADCPDVDIRCRIAVSDLGSTTTSQGCSAGVTVQGSHTADVPTGSVTVDGKCYQTETDSDNAQYLVVGTITIGQCYNAWQVSCQPESCSDNTPAQRCNQLLDGCQISDGQPQCASYATVADGDDASSIATSYGMTLGVLQADNPGVDLSVVQPLEQLCLSLVYNKTPKCEGLKL